MAVVKEIYSTLRAFCPEDNMFKVFFLEII